jgi:hypothetical protein
MTKCARGFIVAGLIAGATFASAEAPARAAARLWNPEAVTTVAGTIEKVEKVEMGTGWQCLKLRIGTPGGAVSVRLGPAWYLEEQRYTFAVGEKLEVKGSRVLFSGEPAIVAGEIVRGGEKITLRDPSGKPLWGAK